MIPWLGFYWDDWPFIWISQKLGPQALANYFSTKRPILGLLYQITTPFVGNIPWHWHVFGLVCRWVNAVTLWWVIRLIWPRETELATWVSILFVIYPGFDQQFIPIAYAHYFITLTAFFLSLGFMILALRKPAKFRLFTVLALLTSLINLLTTEYFFMLDLLRPVLIWIVHNNDIHNRRQHLRRTAAIWLPYLLLFLAPAIWRLLFFQFQTYSYSPILLDELINQPWNTSLQLGKKILQDIWLTSFGAWSKAFQLPTFEELGRINMMRYWLIVAGMTAGLSIYLIKTKSDDNISPTERQNSGKQAFFVGVFGLFTAGWPFWLTKLPITLGFPSSRFTLPFILGTSLFFGGIMQILPKWRGVKTIILAITVGFAVGLHFQIALQYRKEWSWHKSQFWQMAWRMPQLKPGTAIIGNYIPPSKYSDNSLSAPLNYIYAPDNTSEDMYYMYYYPSVRLGRQIPALEKDIPIKHDYLAATFIGSTSQIVTIFYKPPECMRVLDPELDPENQMLPELMREAAILSTTEQILAVNEAKAVTPPADIYGPEPAHGWCYYFEKADLARQQGDWEQIVILGDQGFGLDETPFNPAERIPFIEGYAHVGNWDHARTLTKESYDINPEMMRPVMCLLWQRIDKNTEPSPGKENILQEVYDELECSQ